MWRGICEDGEHVQTKRRKRVQAARRGVWGKRLQTRHVYGYCMISAFQDCWLSWLHSLLLLQPNTKSIVRTHTHRSSLYPLPLAVVSLLPAVSHSCLVVPSSASILSAFVLTFTCSSRLVSCARQTERCFAH